MRVGIALPADLLAFADAEAERRGTSRSGLLADLLRAEQTRNQTRRYIDENSWDVCEDDSAWREYQRQRTALEYDGDDW